MRINKFLANCGMASRRAIDRLIEEGSVSVNGTVLARPGYNVQPTDRIAVNGKEVSRLCAEKIVILLNKPARTITTMRDTHGRRTIANLVQCGTRVFPVGRLDKDTTGVLILTNDGELAHVLMHPSYEIEKVYRAKIDRALFAFDQRRIQCGIMLDGRRTSPCDVHTDKTRLIVTVTLHEGRNRQIHRMFRALGYRVLELDRVRYAGFSAGSLKRGEWRMLTKKEIRKLES